LCIASRQSLSLAVDDFLFCGSDAGKEYMHGVASTNINVTNTQVDKATEYYPPSDEVIDRYIHHVCRELSTKPAEGLNQPEIERGFGNFVKVLVRITVKAKNKGVPHAS
jgi:hypothetical protein